MVYADFKVFQLAGLAPACLKSMLYKPRELPMANASLAHSYILLWVLSEGLGKAVILSGLWYRICFVTLLCYLELLLAHK